MRGRVLSVGYMPLVDAAPLIVAQEMGFAAEEGLTLDLQKAPSWSGVRDMLVYGRVEAAHMLSPVPVAAALGLGGAGASLVAPSVLSINGNVIGVSCALADRLRAQGHDFAFNDAEAAGRALIAAAQPRLRIGVPFPFSMHAELLYYWLSSLGFPAPQNVAIRTVPPPLMAEAIAAGEIDAFCVGEPWGSITVENGVGELLLPCNAIWNFAPEKVLAVREEWADAESGALSALIRAVWRAGKWCSGGEAKSLTAEILSRPDYLDLPAEVLERALVGQVTISPRGDHRHVPGFVEFHRGVASFPWASQAEWIARQMAARLGLDRDAAAGAARRVFRADLYRQALRGTEAELPRASSKVEGALTAETPAGAESGNVVLAPNRFFDGQIFDPDLHA